jgi:PPOX class probable FMN-dependent enzyme
MAQPIQSELDLRGHYRDVSERARRKVLNHLDKHCQQLIGLSPFLVIGTTGPDDHGDVSPRGGEPGFVRVLDETTLAMPDSSGNNRLDSLGNLVANPEVALIFLVPGMDETLRINGTATITDDPDLCGSFDLRGRHPATVTVVKLREAYLHCAKALMRARLWDPEARVDRSAIPSMGQMLKDQIGWREAAESQAEMVERYEEDL